MPLYGHELDDEITPLEAGLDFAVKLSKREFIGKDAIAAKLPIARVRVGLEVTGRGIVPGTPGHLHRRPAGGKDDLGHTLSLPR